MKLEEFKNTMKQLFPDADLDNFVTPAKKEDLTEGKDTSMRQIFDLFDLHGVPKNKNLCTDIVLLNIHTLMEAFSDVVRGLSVVVMNDDNKNMSKELLGTLLDKYTIYFFTLIQLSEAFKEDQDVDDEFPEIIGE